MLWWEKLLSDRRQKNPNICLGENVGLFNAFEGSNSRQTDGPGSGRRSICTGALCNAVCFPALVPRKICHCCNVSTSDLCKKIYKPDPRPAPSLVAARVFPEFLKATAARKQTRRLQTSTIIWEKKDVFFINYGHSVVFFCLIFNRNSLKSLLSWTDLLFYHSCTKTLRFQGMCNHIQ